MRSADATEGKGVRGRGRKPAEGAAWMSNGWAFLEKQKPLFSGDANVLVVHALKKKSFFCG